MNVVMICSIAVVLTVIIVYFKQIRSDFALPLIVVCSLVLLKSSIDVISSHFESINSVLDVNIMGEYGNILLKTLGISLTVQTASDICKDAGERAIASKIELFGRAEMLIISIPLVKKILEISQEIIS